MEEKRQWVDRKKRWVDGERAKTTIIINVEEKYAHWFICFALLTFNASFSLTANRWFLLFPCYKLLFLLYFEVVQCASCRYVIKIAIVWMIALTIPVVIRRRIVMEFALLVHSVFRINVVFTGLFLSLIQLMWLSTNRSRKLYLLVRLNKGLVWRILITLRSTI